MDQPSKLGEGLQLCSAQLSIGNDVFEGRGEGNCHSLVKGGLLETVRSLWAGGREEKRETERGAEGERKRETEGKGEERGEREGEREVIETYA